MSLSKNKIVVAVTGASGALYAKILLQKLTALKEQVDDVGLILSQNAKEVWEYELGGKSYLDFPFQHYEKNNFYAPFASGSAQYNIMFVCPCSMGTLARIATGVSSDLTTRAADVILKERRKLILILRETPYSLIHLQNMKVITEAGGIICPASPSFYHLPQTIEELATTVIDRALDLAGLQINTLRWGEK